jgi:hypothetical protein
MLISEDRLRRVFADALAARDVPGAKRLARAIVSDLGDQHSLIRRAGSERYSFVHQTFLDFLAAMEFSDRLRKAEEEAAVLGRLRNQCGAMKRRPGERSRSTIRRRDLLNSGCGLTTCAPADVDSERGAEVNGHLWRAGAPIYTWP